MMIRKFHVFGQRCSGTNALIRLIDCNFPDLHFCEEVGFKHWLVPPDQTIDPDAVVLVIAREISGWLHSLHAKPWHAHPDLKKLRHSDFIRAEWRSVWDLDFWGVSEGDEQFGRPIMEERCLATGRPFENVLIMRTTKLKNWLGLNARSAKFLTINHAALVSDPRNVVATLADALGGRARSKFVPVDTYKGQGESRFRPKTYPVLTEDDWRFVRRHIDPKLEAADGPTYPSL